VAQLGTWAPDGIPTAQAEPEPRVQQALAAYAPLVDGEAERAWLRAAAGSDAAAWAAELGREIDRTGLAVERNVLRYRPLPGVTVRAGEGATAAELVRVLLAAELAGTPVRVSLAPTLASALSAASPGPGGAGGRAAAWRHLERLVDAVETAYQLVARLRSGAVPAGARVRVIGDEAATLPAALAADPQTVVAGPVLATGRRELLTLLREQAVSHTLHRFGHLPADR
jgi:RHH-type proline utilization regulon transcriptional repressor/proline dehydrogenase/delta 1-pyrroline-5-carboxylate dehydrogenase